MIRALFCLGSFIETSGSMSSSSGSLQKTKESITREKNHRSIQLMKVMEYFLKDRNLNSMINRKDNMFQLSQVYSRKVELAL